MNARSFSCGQCGYAMPDRQPGDHCPECNTPLDPREDDPVALRASQNAIYLVISAILLLPFLGLVSLILLVIARFQIAKRHPLASEYRISFAIKNKRRTADRLAYLFIIVFGAMFIIQYLYPNALNWW